MNFKNILIFLPNRSLQLVFMELLLLLISKNVIAQNITSNTVISGNTPTGSYVWSAGNITLDGTANASGGIKYASTTSGTPATAGNLLINAGAIITSTGYGTIYNGNRSTGIGASLDSIDNSGTIVGTNTTYGAIIVENAFSTVRSTISSIVNRSSGIINGSIQNNGVDIGLITNYGRILGYGSPGSYTYGAIGTLIDSDSRPSTYGITGSIVNYGEINGVNSSNRSNPGIWIDDVSRVNTITNRGFIVGASGGSGIEVAASTLAPSASQGLGTLNNAQGGNSSSPSTTALTYNGKLPTNYNIIINSPTSYGQLSATAPNGILRFGIYSGSTVANGTYSAVLSGLTNMNIDPTTRSGTYNSGTWSLTNSSGSIWDLTFAGVVPPAPPAPSSSNYRANTSIRRHAANAAAVLDNLYTSGGALQPVFDRLDTLSGSAQSNAITQTLPSVVGAASLATTGSMQALNQVIQGRSNSLRGMSSGDEYVGTREVWMKGFGSWANQNDINGVSGYKVNTGGLAIGVDQGLTPEMNIGAVLAFANSGVSSSSSTAPSGVTINSYQVGVYGDYAIEKDIIANAQADIGINQNKEYRNIAFMGTNANGSYNSYAGHVGAGAKYLMPIDMDSTFIPSLRVDYTSVQSQAYNESGAGALNLSVGKQTYNTLIPSADLRIDHSLDSQITLSANAGAGYNTLNNQVLATSAYAGGGPAFVTNGLQVSPWLYNAGVGVTGQIDKNLQLNVRYDNVFSPTGYMNQMVSAKLKIPL